MIIFVHLLLIIITKENNNENNNETILVSIASLSLMFSVNAGELSVSGTAKATYNAAGVQTDNGIGVTSD